MGMKGYLIKRIEFLIAIIVVSMSMDGEPLYLPPTLP
jgi:hypothetical protein